jgi:hypothetical protein
MDEAKRNLIGSDKRDIFRRCHKDYGGDLWSLDGDMIWVEKNPPGIVAYIDYKALNDTITFSEVLAYNQWSKTAPVYIIQADDPETGPFTVLRYEGGNWKPDPPIVETRTIQEFPVWESLTTWERKLRERWRDNGGKLINTNSNGHK